MINEGLRNNDLRDLINSHVRIDRFRSKMGEDQDVCVLTFEVKDREPAKDLMEFLEKGYEFVLDADVSSGETSEGNYNVFLELEREQNIAKNIMEMFYGISRLSGVEDWTFAYHKSNQKIKLTQEALQEYVPNSPALYENMLKKQKIEEYKTFFSNTVYDNIEIVGEQIIIKKPFGVEIKLEPVKDDDTNSILENAPSVDSNAMAEIFWLTKVLGDYNISKYENSFMFSNGDKSILFKRSD